MVIDQNHPSDISKEQGVIPDVEARNMVFSIEEELKKLLEDSYPRYNTLEKRVRRLERDVYSLKDELDDPEVCMNRETIIDLIYKIVSYLIGKKDKDPSHSSESSKDSDSVEIIERSYGYRIREERAVPYAFALLAKQRRKAQLRKVKQLVV